MPNGMPLWGQRLCRRDRNLLVDAQQLNHAHHLGLHISAAKALTVVDRVVRGAHEHANARRIDVAHLGKIELNGLSGLLERQVDSIAQAIGVRDIDLAGYRRPISFLREIVYGLRKEPYIAVERVDKYGKKCSKTPWMLKDNIASWTWRGYEGKPAVVDVYSDAQEVELFLNGKSLGRKAAGEAHGFTASFETCYEPGVLEAVSYQDGRETGRHLLCTAGEEVLLHVAADQKELRADGEDLCFLTMHLCDAKGTPDLYGKRRIHIEVEGAGTLAAFGNADPQSVESYDAPCWETYDGYALAAVRAGREKGEISVTI